MGAAPIQKHHLSGLNERGRSGGQRGLLVGRDGVSGRKVRQIRRHGQGAAMHPLQEALCREFPQIAADRVFGQIQHLGHALGDDLPLSVEGVQNEGFAVRGQHGLCTRLNDNSQYRTK